MIRISEVIKWNKNQGEAIIKEYLKISQKWMTWIEDAKAIKLSLIHIHVILKRFWENDKVPSFIINMLY